MTPVVDEDPLTTAMFSVFPMTASPQRVEEYRSQGWTAETMYLVGRLDTWATARDTGPVWLNLSSDTAMRQAFQVAVLADVWGKCRNVHGMTEDQAREWLVMVAAAPDHESVVDLTRMLASNLPGQAERARSWREVGPGRLLGYAAGLSPAEAASAAPRALAVLAGLRGWVFPSSP